VPAAAEVVDEGSEVAAGADPVVASDTTGTAEISSSAPIEESPATAAATAEEPTATATAAATTTVEPDVEAAAAPVPAADVAAGHR
jgi:hypothetical protein